MAARKADQNRDGFMKNKEFAKSIKYALVNRLTEDFTYHKGERLVSWRDERDDQLFLLWRNGETPDGLQIFDMTLVLSLGPAGVPPPFAIGARGAVSTAINKTLIDDGFLPEVINSMVLSAGIAHRYNIRVVLDIG